MRVTPRLRRRIEHDFPEPGAAGAIEELVVDTVTALDLHGWDANATERIQAAIVLGGGGDLSGVRAMSDLARQDWRDALVASGLADGDWPERLDAELGPA
jgi:hypothetical protein